MYAACGDLVACDALSAFCFNAAACSSPSVDIQCCCLYAAYKLQTRCYWCVYARLCDSREEERQIDQRSNNWLYQWFVCLLG